MNQPINELKELYEQAWSLILRGKSDRKHPYAFPVFASVSPTLHPRSRTLVLRNALKTSGELWCYTDRRSRKAEDLATNAPFASYTFWSPRARIQVSACGPTAWLDEGRTREIFNSLPKHSRKAYATTAAPGSHLEAAGEGLPQNWADLDPEQTDYASENFGVLVTSISEMDILQLHREGHRRMRALRDDEDWKLSWLVP